MITSEQIYPLTLKGNVIKFIITMLTIIIGLLCGQQASYNAFFIAVLVQSLNNIYSSLEFMEGYGLITTIFQILSAFFATIAFITSVLHFAGFAKLLDHYICVVIIACLLSFPLLYLGSIIVIQIQKREF